jgi:hypothetical protein
MLQHLQLQYEIYSISIGPLGPRWGITAAVAGHRTAERSPHMPPADMLPSETQGKASVLSCCKQKCGWLDGLNPHVTQ